VPACAACGRAVGLRYHVNPIGEAICGNHAREPPCALCSLPVSASLSDATARYCRRCAATAVVRQAHVSRLVPPVKERLHRLGLHLRTPVRVRLVPPGELLTAAGTFSGATPCGLTVSVGNQVVDLMIAEGLPAVQFGATVAHEATHAWMIQNGFPALPGHLAEGLCQLTAYAWARREAEPLAAIVQQQIEKNPDVVYGDGFRQVYQAARRSSVAAVMRSLKTTGRLP